MPDRAVGAVWQDFTGRTRLTVIKAAVNPCTILNQLQLVSNADVLYNWDGPIDGQIGVAVSAQYQAVQQWCELMFHTAAGTILRLALPAPQLAILMADKKTINPGTIAALVAACVGNLSDGAGNTATVYLGGVLQTDRSDLQPIG